MQAERTVVWDLPVRVAHWLLVLAVAGSWLTHYAGPAWFPSDSATESAYLSRCRGDCRIEKASCMRSLSIRLAEGAVLLVLMGSGFVLGTRLFDVSADIESQAW